jgi:hypothetical protein
MSNIRRNKKRLGEKRLEREMQNLRKEMDPHFDKTQSGKGMMAMLLVNGITNFVIEGIESEEYLQKTIQSASETSDIPKSALKAYSDFIKAGQSGYKMSARTSPFVGGA